MKLSIILLTTVVLAAATGCSQKSSTPIKADERTEMNRWTVNSYYDDMSGNAIIAQHTFYPYHFLANSAELNELGTRQLSILADHYRENPGPLNIRKGAEPASLHQKRVNAVLTLLKDAGVPTDRVISADGLPGGDGSGSDRVLTILEPNDESSSDGS